MRRTSFNQYIKDAGFRGLFITEMGWNRFHGQAELAPIAIEDKEYRIVTVAERNGFQILTCAVDEIPTNTFASALTASCAAVPTTTFAYSSSPARNTNSGLPR